MAQAYYCPTCKMHLPPDSTWFDFIKGKRVHQVTSFVSLGTDPAPLKHEEHRVLPVLSPGVS